MSSLFILLVGHNYRAAFDVNLCLRKLSNILGGKEMELRMGRKKQVEDWEMSTNQCIYVDSRRKERLSVKGKNSNSDIVCNVHSVKNKM